MSSLFEISERFKNLMELVGSEAIEGSEEVLQEALNSLEGELTDKLTNVTYILRKQEADLTAIDMEIKRLQERKKVMSNNNESLKSYMFNCMKFADVKKINTALNTWSIAKSPVAVQIENEEVIDRSFVNEVVTYKVDKKRIKEALQNGEAVEGAKLVQGESLRIK